jgi:hypothetical protein
MIKSNPPAKGLPRRADAKLKALLLFLFGRVRSGSGLGCLRLHHALLEFIHAPGGIHEFLRARIERVAHVANPDQDRLSRRTGLDHVPARATNLGFLVFRMYIGFHLNKGRINYRETALWQGKSPEF